jgi:hypothetical protein
VSFTKTQTPGPLLTTSPISHSHSLPLRNACRSYGVYIRSLRMPHPRKQSCTGYFVLISMDGIIANNDNHQSSISAQLPRHLPQNREMDHSCSLTRVVHHFFTSSKQSMHALASPSSLALPHFDSASLRRLQMPCSRLPYLPTIPLLAPFLILIPAAAPTPQPIAERVPSFYLYTTYCIHTPPPSPSLTQ